MRVNVHIMWLVLGVGIGFGYFVSKALVDGPLDELEAGRSAPVRPASPSGIRIVSGFGELRSGLYSVSAEESGSAELAADWLWPTNASLGAKLDLQEALRISKLFLGVISRSEREPDALRRQVTGSIVANMPRLLAEVRGQWRRELNARAASQQDPELAALMRTAAAALGGK